MTYNPSRLPNAPQLSEKSALNFCDSIEKVFQDPQLTPHFAHKFKEDLPELIKTKPEWASLNPAYFAEMIDSLISGKKNLSDIHPSQRKILSQFLQSKQAEYESILDKHFVINLKKQCDLRNLDNPKNSLLTITQKLNHSYHIAIDKIIGNIEGNPLTPATPFGPRAAVYSDPSLPDNDGSGTQLLFNTTYKGQKVAMARGEGREEAFEKQYMEIRDFTDDKDATVKLKLIFAKDKDQFPKIWEQDNWFKSDVVIFKLLFDWLSKKRIFNDMPYAGYQNRKGELKHVDMYAGVYLPYRINGKFIHLQRSRERPEVTWGAVHDINSKDAFPIAHKNFFQN